MIDTNTHPVLTLLSPHSKEKNLKDVTQLHQPKSNPTEEKIDKVAKDFESLLIGELFKVMRKTIHKSELTKGGFGEEIFESMLDGEMSKSLAQRDMLGISDMLKKELLGKINESSQVNRNLTMPAIGRITSKFGTREHPITHKMSHHDGIDISLKEGTPIKASMGGKVIFSGEKSGYGNVIIVKSGDYETIYGHCSELLFNKGDNIKKGEKIALSGNTGVSTGPHLHFEIRKKGKAIDPFTLIK